MKKSLFFVIIIMFLLSLKLGFSFSISPAIERVDFKPGLELGYSFHVEEDSRQKLEIYSEGDFSNMVKFDKKELIGSGDFNVRIKLPEDVDIPGKHTLLIGVREKKEPNSEGQTIGTSITLRVPIIVSVPYPGKYAEISFSLNNVNQGDPVKFEVTVASMGKEPINANTKIEIYSGKNKITTLDLGNKIIENQNKYVFVKFLDTKEYHPGDYNATAIVDYQEGISRESNIFRIGTLFLNITNYTLSIVKEGIKPFMIDVESLWNNPVENVYGQIFILKDNNTLTSFSTPSVIVFQPWEKRTLTGYVDTGLLNTGGYDIRMVLNYLEKNTTLDGKLKIKNKTNYQLYGLLIIVLLLIIISLIFFVYKFKNKIFKNAKHKK
jgi:hypothetical protein